MVKANKRYLLLFCIMVMLGSCSVLRVKHKSRFAQKKAFVDSSPEALTVSLLRMDEVYYRKWEAFMPGKGQITQYSGMRFYPNNQFAFMSFDTVPVLESFEEADSLDLNYYILENDSIIKLEVWRDDYTSYGRWTGTIYPDKIVFTRVNGRRELEIYSIDDSEE